MTRKPATTKTRKAPRQPCDVADTGRVRFGSGMTSARIARIAAPGTSDTGAIRFGSGMTPARLAK
jgi:hypothetical protein